MGQFPVFISFYHIYEKDKRTLDKVKETLAHFNF